MPTPPARYSAPTPPRDMDRFDGVLVVDKPSGPTSHDIVDLVRHQFRIRKVGHGGTLDPLATGLLIILLGKGTKISSRFMGSDKTYTGTLRLGIETNSQDADGEVTREADPSGVTEAALQAAMDAKLGDSFQIPPMVSAIKVKGVPLYKHARQGRTIERDARLIHLYEFHVTAFTPPDASFTVTCTKGTYVRTLAADIGTGLGCGAHLTALRRTRSGDLTLDGAVTIDELEQMTLNALAERVLPLRTFA